MNIFMLSLFPGLAAAYHNKKHYNKLLLESCQLLYTAHHQNNAFIELYGSRTSDDFGQNKDQETEGIKKNGHVVRATSQVPEIVEANKLESNCGILKIDDVLQQLISDWKDTLDGESSSVSSISSLVALHDDLSAVRKNYKAPNLGDWNEECFELLKYDTLKELPQPYRASHLYHPSARWVRTARENYRYVSLLALSLCAEYRYRKVLSQPSIQYQDITHGCFKHVFWLATHFPPFPDRWTNSSSGSFNELLYPRQPPVDFTPVELNPIPPSLLVKTGSESKPLFTVPDYSTVKVRVAAEWKKTGRRISAMPGFETSAFKDFIEEVPRSIISDVIAKQPSKSEVKGTKWYKGVHNLTGYAQNGPGSTPVPLAMPATRWNNDAVLAYRFYYVAEKRRLNDFSPQIRPYWLIDYTDDDVSEEEE